MFFIYQLSDISLAFFVLGMMTLVCLTSYLIFRRFFQKTVTDDQRVLALAVLPIIATVHSLLLAFTSVSVWGAYTDAETAVANEANVVAQLARDLSVYGGEPAVYARKQLRVYAETVINDEWPRLAEGNPSVEAASRFDALFRSIGQLEPDTPRRAAQLGEIWGRINEMVRHRRERLDASRAIIPPILWIVVIAGTALTMLTVFVLPHSRFNIVMIGMLASSVGLVFLFLLAMEHPFAGGEHVAPDPFANAIAHMDRWDRETAPK